MDHGAVVDQGNVVLAWALLILLAAIIACAVIGTKIRIVAYLAVFPSLALQLFHTGEHLIQVAFWGRNPLAAPYMSPIAKKAASGLESIGVNVLGMRDMPTLGMELLHLVGNSLFLAGVVGLLVGAPFAKHREGARFAVIFEGLHMGEHLVLTSVVLSGSPAWGTSTLFNTISGSQLSSYRIWWHLIMNVAALAFFIAALVRPGFAARRRKPLIFVLVAANFVPLLMASRYGIPASGFRSADELNDLSALFALAVNPVTLAAAYLLFNRRTAVASSQN